MNNHLPKILLVLLIISLFLGALQGTRINTIKETETFYRWAVSTASLTRMGDTLEPDVSADIPDPMDDEIFAQLNEIAETLLPDYPVDEEFDLNPDGAPQSKLVRAVRQSHDSDIWDILQKPELKDVQKTFLSYLATNQIQSIGTQLSASSLYGEASTVDGVGLTGMFFGLRTLAANFLWMQVDSHWHTGELHRMVPLMRTCVTFDPNFIDAYLLGAWHLSYNIPAKIEPTPEPLKKFNKKYNRRLGLREEWYYMAVDFLRDGIRKNPRDYRLYFDLGYAVYAQKLNDHPNAIRYLDEARRHKHDKWVPRMLFRSLFRNGQYEDAIEGWEEYLIEFPDHDIGKRFLEINKGFLADAIADDAQTCSNAARDAKEKFQTQLQTAQTQGNQLEIDRLNAEIQKADAFIEEMNTRALTEINTAAKIWIKLLDNENDTMAKGRLVRRKALALKQEGRYLEAIAELDLIRWQDLLFFDEASNIMIEIKQENGLPLTVSEQLQVLRLEDAAQFMHEEDKPKKIRRIECDYMDDAV